MPKRNIGAVTIDESQTQDDVVSAVTLGMALGNAQGRQSQQVPILPL
jgi:hypothetical protein